MERASWVDWRAGVPTDTSAGRCYLGHETCQELLPTVSVAGELARRLRDRGKRLTLVTPFLTDRGLDLAQGLVERLLAEDDRLEVVCSDWGLLAMLGRGGMVRPVVGRVLAMQAVDPRVARMLDCERDRPSRPVQHVDGTQCALRYRPPLPAMARHLRSCWLDRPEIFEFLVSLGVQRCEISNVAQGLELAHRPGWTYSLHVPEVLVAVMRRCPAAGEDFAAGACRGKGPVRGSCGGSRVPWRLEGMPSEIFRVDNALFYRNDRVSVTDTTGPIDRIVVRHGG